jgi:hypothetical protein
VRLICEAGTSEASMRNGHGAVGIYAINGVEDVKFPFARNKALTGPLPRSQPNTSAASKLGAHT